MPPWSRSKILLSRMEDKELPMVELVPLGEYHATGYTYDERMLLHREIESDDHPEQPGRLQTIIEHLQGAGILERCAHVQVRDAATNDLLAAVHTPAHLEFMCSLQGRIQYSMTGLKSLHCWLC